IASVVAPPRAPMAAATGEAAAVKPPEGGAPSPNASTRERTAARVPSNETGTAEPEIEATGTISHPADANEPSPATGDRVANVSPQPDDPMAAPAEVMQPPTLASPRARKAAARTRNVARVK